jgi:hypothetical protein
MTLYTLRCATRVRGKFGGTRRCARTLRWAQTPGNWWNCWQHEKPGQVIDVWFASHPRELDVVHWWTSGDVPLRLCDGDNSVDVPEPTHHCNKDAKICEACKDIWLMGMDRFHSHYTEKFGVTMAEEEAAYA